MNKLLKLREWLPLHDACRFLSAAVSEPITQSDLLGLALEKNLKLSIRLAKLVSATRATVKPFEEVLRFEPPAWLGQSQEICAHEDIVLGDEVVALDGVFDLPMVGRARLIVEQLLNEESGDLSAQIANYIGILVEGAEGCFQLLLSREENEAVNGSRAHLEHLEARILDFRLSIEEAGQLRRCYAADRAAFLRAQAEQAPVDRLDPMHQLPSHCSVGVRTSELIALKAKLESPGSAVDSPREQTTLLNTIAALLELAGSERSRRQSDSELIDELVTKHGTKQGIKTRTLQGTFAKAKRSLRSE